MESVYLSKTLQTRLLQLYNDSNIVDIFWGCRFSEQDKGWNVYVVTTCDTIAIEKKEMVTKDEAIYFIPEVEGFFGADIHPQNPDDPLPVWKELPQNLQKAFDEALDNELGRSFREAHYNLVGLSTGFKRIGNKLTNTPAIIFYVRQKGFLRRGCVSFPEMIRGFPTDVLEACIPTTCGNYGAKYCKKYQSNVCLSAGIGMGMTGLRRTLGTLGAVVTEIKSQKQIGIITCEHVAKFSDSDIAENITIYQPSHEDFLEKQKRTLIELHDESNKPGANKEYYKNKIEEMQKSIASAHREVDNTILATYVRGLRENYFSTLYNCYYGIDAAFCVFVNMNRTLNPIQFSIPDSIFEDVGLPRNTRLKGVYTHDELRKFNTEIDVFKVGRTTGVSVGKVFPSFNSVAIDMRDSSIKLANEDSKVQVPTYNEELDNYFIGYMKASLVNEIREKRQLCFPIKWFDRQLLFRFRHGDLKAGDSGSSLVDKEGRALGLIHAKWVTHHTNYGIASPYFVVLEALEVEFCLTPHLITIT
jgi:hypothetical protein